MESAQSTCVVVVIGMFDSLCVKMFEKREYVRMREEHSILANSFPKIRYFRRRRHPKSVPFVRHRRWSRTCVRARGKCSSKSSAHSSVKFLAV